MMMDGLAICPDMAGALFYFCSVCAGLFVEYADGAAEIGPCVCVKGPPVGVPVACVIAPAVVIERRRLIGAEAFSPWDILG